MIPQVELIPGSIYSILADSRDKGYISQGDRYGLMAAFVNDNLSEQEMKAIDRLLRAIIKGKIKFYY
jgi:hypothetical protein